MASHGIGADVTVYTQCQLQNLAGGNCSLKLDNHKSWNGSWSPPETFPTQNSVNFKHYSDAEGSIACVVYTLVVEDTDTLKWVVAWCNKKLSSNEVYTVILEANTTVDWNKVKIELEKSGNESSDKNLGYKATAFIEKDSPTPKLTATLEKA